MKKLLISVFLIFSTFALFAKSGNSTQIIKSGHWIYDDLESLCMEAKTEFFFETQPMTIGEIKFYLKKISYENLSDNGKALYDKVDKFLSKNEDFFPEEEVRLFGNIKTNPEFYWKSNKEIEWSFDYYVRDYFLTIPLIIGFSDYVTIEPDFVIGKNQPESAKPYNFTNIIYSGQQLEFMFPRFAYGAAGHAFDKWGVDFYVGKEGLQLYNTQLGSIVYNRTFETDAYCSLNLYTEYLKYSMHVAQVDNTKFLYMHQLNMRPFNWLKLHVLEGSLLNAPFELRYLNPFMLMHQYGSWTQYKHLMNDTEFNYYTEGHFCAYFGIMFEVLPFKNFRLYGLFSQNEILDAGGSRTDEALSVPDSIGGQLGMQYNILLNNGDYLKNYLEAVYTSPYLYVKHSPDWSLYRSRPNMQGGDNTITWIGSPFGPDSFAVLFKTEYNNIEKWKLGFSYTFSVHGENNAASLFCQKAPVNKQNDKGKEIEGQEIIYTYYPSVKYKLAKTDEDRAAARDEGRNMWMTGANEFKNQIKLYGDFSLNEHLAFYGQTVYIIKSKNNELNHGIELSCGVEYKLF